MNITEKRAAAKQVAIETLALDEKGTQIGNFEYVVEVEVEGETFYVSFPATVKDTKGTKETENRAARPPFVLESAVAAFAQEKEEAAVEAAEKAAKVAKIKAKEKVKTA